MAVQINVAANQAALIGSIQAGVQAYNQRFAAQNQVNLQINARGFSQPLGRITGDVKDFEAALAASNARVIAFGASTAVLGGVVRGFKALADVTIEVEKNLTDINRVFGLTTSQLQKFSGDLFDVSKATASSFGDASKAALEFSRQGLKAVDTLERTKDALSLARIAGISTADAVDTLTSTVNGFAKTGITTSQVLNKLVAVEQEYAVGAGDLAQALSRTGQAAQEAGVDIDQLNALVTAAQQNTARGGAVIGNALKTIFTRLQRSDTLDQLEMFNVAVRDVQGNILPAVTILKNFASVYRTLGDAQRAQLSEQVAGVNQINILKAVVNDLNNSQSTYEGALKKGASATNEATAAAAQLNQTLSALLSQTGTAAEQLAFNIGKVTFEPLAKNATQTVKSIVEGINELLQGDTFGSDLANGLLKGLRNTLAGPGAVAAFYTLFKLIQNSFTYITQALPQIAGITTETQKRQNVEAAILQIMSQQTPIAQALLGTAGNQAAQSQLLLQLARQQTAEYQQQAALAKQLASTLVGQGVTAKGQSGLQVTRAGGYIPASARNAEMRGARAGGYVPGAVINSPVGGVMNSAESVRYIPGFAQPFINPPIGSMAGQAHRQNSISRTGVDPYRFGGFIPNFAEINKAFVTDKIKIKDGDTVSGYPVEPISKDYRLAEADAVESNQMFNNEAIQLLKNYGYENASKLNDSITKGKAAYYRGTFADKALARDLIDKGYAVPDLRYTKDQDLINLAKERFFEGLDNKNEAKGLWRYATHPKTLQFEMQGDKLGILYKSEDIQDKYKRTVNIGEPVFKDKTLLDSLRYQGSKNVYDRKYADGFIPNFADMSMSQIAAAVRLGRMSEADARAMGWKPTSEKISERKTRTAQDKADKLAGITYRNIDIPWKTYDEFGGSTIDYGAAYESFALSQLKGKYPGILDAISAGIPGGPSSRVDAIDHASKTFFEMKGGDPTTPAELMAKFKGVRQQLADKYRKELDSWNDVLVSNPNWGYSNGFIPNFAYKQSVMGLEQNLSGNKAIFDTNPFPHIRNASQPTFSSAIADHGGLSKAMSDSVKNQRAAGLVHGGFIPNFAPMGLDPIRLFGGQGLGALTGMQRGQYAELEKALAKLRNATNLSANDTQLLSQDVKNYARQLEITTGSTKIVQDANRELNVALRRNAQAQTTAATTTTTSSFDIKNFGSKLADIAGYLPMAAGFVEQFAFGNKQRTEMTAGERMGQSAISAGATAVGTGAFYGNMILPGWGAAIGAGVGALYGWVKAVDAASLTTEELAKINQENANKIQESITSANSYIGAQKNLSDLASSGASQDKIKSASLQLAKSFSEIKDVKLQEIFNKVGTSAEKMQEALSKYAQEQNKTQAAAKIGEFGKNNSLFSNRTAEEQGILSASKTSEFVQTLYNAGIKSESLRGITSAGARAYLKAQGEIKTNEGDVNVRDNQNTFVEAKYKEQFLKENKSSIEDILKKSNLKEGTDEFSKAYEALGDALFSPQGIENLKNLTGLEKSVAERLKKNVELAQKEFSAYEYKRDLMLQNMRYVAETNRLLKTNESERKLKEGVFNFQQDLLSSIVNPLDAISSKFKFMSSQLEAELNDKLKEINTNYVKENYDKINGLISDKEFIESTVAPAFEKAKKGNFSEMVDLTSNETLRTKYPEALSQVQGSLESRRQTIRDVRQDNEKQQKTLEQDARLQTIKQEVSKTQYSLLKSETDLVTERQRLEIMRKSNLDLEINTLERQMGDEARYLGRGIVGSAVEKSRFRTEISDKKIAEEERTKSMSSQSDLNDIYLMQRQNYLIQAADAKLKGDSMSSQGFKFAAAGVNVNRNVTNLETLRSEIGNLEKISFKNLDQDTKRIKTLEKLKALEQDILSGKKKEADLVKGINEDEIERARRSTSFTYGMKEGIDELYKGAETLGNRLGKQIPTQFADGMTNALMEVAKGTKSIGDAFSDMAINFGQMIMQEVMRAAIGRVVGSAFTNMFGQTGGSVGGGAIGRQAGGMIYAQNGMYISGGRTGDKNPAMLEDGEYVLNRNAVKAFGGPAALDKFNFDSAPRFGRGFQEGGGFSLAPELGATDYSGNQLYNGVNAGAIDASNFSAYAYANDEYFTKLREKSIQQYQEKVQKDFAKKQRTAQLVSSIVGAVGSLALAGGMANAAAAAEGGTAAIPAIENGTMKAVTPEIQKGLEEASKAGAAETSKFIQKNANSIMLNGNLLTNVSNLGAEGMTISNGVAKQAFSFSKFTGNQQLVSVLGKQGLVAPQIGKAGFFKNLLQPAYNSTTGILGSTRHQTGGYIGYNSGGFVPHGSRLSDTIPALLTGGEYVMNNSAVKKYGLGTMNMMNAGAFQSGGSNSTSSSNTNNTNNNATNISINVDRNGRSVYGANNSSYESTDIMFSKKMAKQINNIVVKSMSNEKRYGGELYKNPLRT
jgi:TP901 family phage tail tape measure protein